MNKHSTLALVYTDKCNAQCSICSFACTPKKSNKMTVEAAKKYIDEASSLGYVKQMAITGGEALLYYNEILEIVRYASQKKIRVVCNSNGFWADTLDHTGLKMVELIKAGLSELVISVDEFHMEYIPVQNIRNIIEASKILGLRVSLECVVLKNSKRMWDIAKEIGDCMIDINITERRCCPFGNASHIERDLFITESVERRRCRFGDVITILPNGKVYSCCSEGGFTDIMNSGNLNDEGIECIVSHYAQNKIMFLLKCLGIDWFLQVIKNEELDIKVKEKYINICEACFDIFKDKSNIEKLQPYIDDKIQQLSR